MSRLYQVELLDQYGNSIAMLDITGVTWRRRFNQANNITFSFPAADEKTKEIKLAREFFLYRDGRKVARGKITHRDVGGTSWVISAMSPEIYLESMLLPPEWGGIWEGTELRTVIEDLLRPYVLRYVNTKDDYAKAVEMVNLDIDTEPGTIMLATKAGVDQPTGLPTRTYYESGYAIFQFDCAGHVGFERIRWSQDIGDVVRVKIAVRTGDGTNWSPWSDDLENRTDAENIGIDLRSLLHGDYSRYIQVRVTLETEDTETPLYDWDEAEEHNEQVFGFTPVFRGLELVYRMPGRLTLDAPVFGINVKNFRANSDNHLSVLTDLAEKYRLEYYVDTDLVLHVRKAPARIADFDETEHLGKDYSDEFIFVEGKDVRINVLNDDDSELVNILYCYGAGRGPGRLSLPEPLRNEESIALYGERVGEFSDTSIEDRETLLQEGLKYLEEKSTPIQTFRIETVWKDDMPELSPGDIVTVTVPTTGLLVSARVLDIEYQEDQGEVIRLGLNTKLRNIIDRVSDIESSLPREREQDETPKTPIQFRATGVYGAVVLSWLGQEESYVIEHSTAGPEGPWNLLESNVTTTTYLHSSLPVGSEHWYRVSAVRRNRRSEFTEPRKAVVQALPQQDIQPDLTPPDVPTIGTLTAYAEDLGNGQYDVMVIIPFTTGERTAQVVIERRLQGTAEWQTVGYAITSPYIDRSGLKFDATYEYRIKAMSQHNIASEYSTVKIVKIDQGSLLVTPEKPTGLSSIPVFKGFYLTWNAVQGPPPIDRYELQYDTGTGGTWANNWRVASDTIVSTFYSHEALDVNLQYRYRLRAWSKAGRVSEWSDVVVAGHPGKASLAEETVGELAYNRLPQQLQTEITNIMQELDQAGSGLQEAQNRLSSAEQRLTQAETRLTSAEGSLAALAQDLSDAEQRLTTAEDQLADARSRLTDAEERLEEAEQALEQVEGVVQEHTVTLQTHAQEIAARVTQQVFNALEQRVTDAEAELSIHAQEIQARVERTVFDALKNTVESHTATLQAHAQEIAARVTQEVFDILAATVSQHEATLQVHANAIAAKVEQTVFDALASRVSQAEAQLAVHADEIQARVKQEDFDDLEDRVTQAESTLTIHAEQIATKVEQTVVDALAGRVSQAETAIQQKADKIELTALSQEVDTIEQRVTTAETTLTQKADKIELNALSQEVDSIGQRVTTAETTLTQKADKIELNALSQEVDTLGQRVSTAETTLTQKADKIELNALSEEVDTLGQRVTSAETTLTQKADKIELNAVRQDLDQLSGTVATHEATLQTHAQQIAARVTQEVFDVLEGRVTQAEAELNILADEIQARVEKTVFDALAETVAEHSATLDIHANEIAARVKQTVFDTLEQRVTNAEATLQAHAGEIAARVTQTTFDALKRVVDSRPKTKPQGGILFPFDTTLFGTGGIKPLDGFVATLRPGEGRFGGAVAVEEGTVNLCAESSYSAYATTNLGLVTMDTPHGRQEVFEFAVSSGRSNARAHKSFSIVAGKTYTVSFVAKAEKPYARMSIGSIKFWPEAGADVDYTLGPVVSKELGNGWTYFAQSVSISSTNRDSMSLMAVMSNALPGDKAWVYNFQAEEKPFATSFVDGTRAGGVLTYDASIMPVQSATVAAWVWVPPSSHWPTSAFRRIISNNNSSTESRAIVLYFRPSTRGLYLSIRDDANTQQVISTPSSITEGWHHIAATWDVSRMALYVDGSLVAQQTNPSLPTSHPNPWIAVGSRTDNMDHLNSLIDELLILPYAASEEEIRSWYEAQAPFYDPDDVAYTAGRVEQHEATLQIHAGQIASKVERSEFDQLSGRVTQAETTIQQKADQVVVTAMDSRLQTAEQNISSLAVTAQEISTAVANVQDGLTQAQSAIQQNANQIALRVQAVDANGNPITNAQLVIAQKDGQGRIILSADQILLDGSVKGRHIAAGQITGDHIQAKSLKADDIGSGTLTLSGNMKITSAGGQLSLDSQAMKARPSDVNHDTMILSPHILQFRDIDNKPSIGIGYVWAMHRELAPNIPDEQRIKYGLLLAQGEIRATGSVLRESLIPGSFSNDLVLDNTLMGRKLEDKSVTIHKLSEMIQVPDITSPNVLRHKIDGPVVYNRENTGPSITLTKQDGDLFAESIRIAFTAEGVSGVNRIRVYVNNTLLQEFENIESPQRYEVVLDVRQLPNTITIDIKQGRDYTVYYTDIHVYQNNQLPLRYGAPIYAVREEVQPTGCFSTCQVACEAYCEAVCETVAEIPCSCETACEQYCQAACQTVSQGGGGCLREGTPVTVWRPDLQQYVEVPVEQLQPGDILPYYDPQTDSLRHTTLRGLHDAKYSTRFLRISTDCGPAIECTYSQLFDVMVNTEEGWKWQKLQAKYLTPGMRLIRPLDVPERRIATIVEVKEVSSKPTRFWLPLTVDHTGFIAAGYGDQEKLIPI